MSKQVFRGKDPFAPGGGAPIDTDLFVLKGGDTMTGLLILSGNATAQLGAVTLQQLQAAAPLDAPVDGKIYARQDGAWVELEQVEEETEPEE